MRVAIGPDGRAVPLVDQAPTLRTEPATQASKTGLAEVTTGPKGLLVIAFAQLAPVIDADGDVTLPGAFPRVEVPLSQWGHAAWQPGFLPIGRGQITEEGKWAVWRGRMFLSTIAGRETFEVLRELGPLSEFSYGLNVLDSELGHQDGQRVRFLRKLAIHEVSPCLRGSGVQTHLVELSSQSPDLLRAATIIDANDRAVAGQPARGVRPVVTVATGRADAVARARRLGVAI